MQKKLIALAVAGMIAAPVAMAQSNVQIYGVADMAVGSVKNIITEDSVTVVDDNVWSSSRLGFRGTEDLGNGTKAIFQFEMGTIDMDNGGGVNMGRDTFVGLTGGFGTVRLGRYGTPLQVWGGGFEASGLANYFRTNFALASGGLGAVGSGTIRATFDDRVANFASYVSPNMNGLVLAAAYGADEVDNVSRDIYGIGARYTNGPLDVAYIYHRAKNVSDIHWVAGAYDFGAAKVMAEFSQGKNIGDNEINNVNDDSERQWSIGLTAPVSEAGTVGLSYGSMDDWAGVNNGPEARSIALTYTHKLSARTTMYAGIRDSRVKDLGPDTTKGRVIAAGLRHTF